MLLATLSSGTGFFNAVLSVLHTSSLLGWMGLTLLARQAKAGQDSQHTPS